MKKQPVAAPKIRKTIPRSKVYVVTYAQNATPVHKPFFAALQVYCRARGATLIVIPGRYKNPTSLWNENNETDEWWAAETQPFLFDGVKTLGDHLTIHGDISIQPTAKTPLSDFEVYAGACSAVFGHPRLQLRTVATGKRRYPRILTTTGACTLPNYTRSKAGKKAEAHHVFGATVIEQGSKLFHMRQINATKDGSFIDLDVAYDARGTRPAARPLGIVFGDIHVDMSDSQVLAASFTRPDSMMRRLQPVYAVYHDVLHFGSRSHHKRHDFSDRYRRARGLATDDVAEEVIAAVRFLDEMTPQSTQAIVVRDNHSAHFDRWLNEADFRSDPKNARFFIDAWSLKLEKFEATGAWTPAFELCYEIMGEARARFLQRDDPFKLGDIEVSFHGHSGANGSRGSLGGFAKLGVKSIVAHTHTPGIQDGCTMVGVGGALDQEYNELPSSWMNTHCIVYANGKRSLVNIIDGEWCGR
jgi:hypothetical protein